MLFWRLLLLTVKIPIYAQPNDVDYFSAGWLFAPVVGVWGLSIVIIGLVQSAAPKRRIENFLLPIMASVSVGLAYAAYLVAVFGSGIIRSVGRDEPFFLLYFGWCWRRPQ
ncbi:MAG: hypothetical protein NWF00_06445 [Candidatus Bathyarchaeota archaeon]|nr:hypothetical protein [Candidatus Bathyarchaeota archaeon]